MAGQGAAKTESKSVGACLTCAFWNRAAPASIAIRCAIGPFRWCACAHRPACPALPCPSSPLALRIKARNWVKDGGGFERVRQHFLKLVGHLVIQGQ